MLTFNYGSPYFWNKVVLTKFISLCQMVWDLTCGTSWFYKSKTGKVTGGWKSAILPNWCCLLSSTVLFTHPWDGKKIGNQTFDNHWHMDYWLDTNCCYNNNATLWIRAKQNLSNVSYGIVQNLFCAELWDLWNEVKVS